MILQTVSVGSMQVNCYIIAEAISGQAIVIDPGDDYVKIKKALGRYKLSPAFIINTHGHIDHIGCDDKFGVSVYVHRDDVPLLKDPSLNLSTFLAQPFKVTSEIRPLEDKEKICLGNLELEVIHTPGHTPGGISLLVKKPESKILFTGDSLFCGGIGRSDFPGADGDVLISSIKEKLLSLPADTVIYPGHGPSSSIGSEKKNNPFLN